MVIMNAGTAWITNLSPMISRVSFSMWHAGYAMGEAAAKIVKAKTAVVGYTDFPPGKDSLDAFKRGFEAAGGKVIDEIPMGGPGQVPDFTPFFQRAKDKKPDVFFVFVPAGDHAVAVVKTYGALGMRAGRHQADRAGRHHAGHQAAGDGRRRGGPDHDAPLQRRPRQCGQQAPRRRLEEGVRPESTPDFMGIQGYDGMAAIAHVVTTLKGKMDPDKAMEALKGWKYDEPARPDHDRPGDARHRDERVPERSRSRRTGGSCQKNIGVINAVKDMCKELKEGRCK